MLDPASIFATSRIPQLSRIRTSWVPNAVPTTAALEHVVERVDQASSSAVAKRASTRVSRSRLSPDRTTHSGSTNDGILEPM